MSSQPDTIISNVPEFSVSELAGSLKRTLEDTYGRVRVRGELSRISIAGSGHLYSSLKDDGAVIDAVAWKGTLSKLQVKPEEGLEVICTGRVSSYPKSSKYQLIIESMELAGEGALLKMLEERKKRLAAEGLFDESRKKPLPFLPGVIGVVTSPSGAVIRDILHRLRDRFPRRVLVWPVLVQGDGAAEQITAAIEGFDNMGPAGSIPRPDLLIVARGGGSLEDLMPFNEENVVRAAANCSIPLISAVGHETDTTLIDYAADQRAPTPTGAAEIAVPRRDQLYAQILDDEKRLFSASARLIQDAYSKLENYTARLGDPARLLELQTQRLDHLAQKMDGIFAQYLAAKDKQLQHKISQLTHPKYALQGATQSLENLRAYLERAGKTLTKDFTARLDTAARMLESLSFKKVLERGYAVVRDDSGTVISDPGRLKSGQGVTLEFKDDQSTQAVIGKGAPKKPSKAKDSRQDQQSLF